MNAIPNSFGSLSLGLYPNQLRGVKIFGKPPYIHVSCLVDEPMELPVRLERDACQNQSRQTYRTCSAPNGHYIFVSEGGDTYILIPKVNVNTHIYIYINLCICGNDDQPMDFEVLQNCSAPTPTGSFQWGTQHKVP